mgnify:CR=1 FL=1
MKTPKILLVDDEPDIVEFLSYNLKKEGYEVVTAYNGVEGLKQAKIQKPDLILLDMMMSEMDGIECCKEIKKVESLKKTLVVFLTAKTEDASQITGYESGADDYVTKPIKPMILMSKIKAWLNRALEESDAKKTIEVEGMYINRDTYDVQYQGENHVLPRKEFELLSLLASNPGKVFTRDEILEKVWGNEVVVGGRTIDVHIRKLRERFGNEKFSTTKGIGYKMNP